MVDLKRIYWSRQALRVAYSAVVLWLGASVVLVLMPKAIPAGTRSTATVTEVLRGMVDGVLAAIAVPGLFVVVLTIVAAVIHARDVKRRDPVRRFSRQQRREGMARVGGQYEVESGLRQRCPQPAEHGDHFYPWSKGGSTSLENFVAACARCNRTKGVRVPSPGQQSRMERRRREYAEARPSAEWASQNVPRSTGASVMGNFASISKSISKQYFKALASAICQGQPHVHQLSPQMLHVMGAAPGQGSMWW